jgi:hypothetical protein
MSFSSKKQDKEVALQNKIEAESTTVTQKEPGKTEFTSNTVTTTKEGETKTFNCDKCSAIYNTEQNLVRHKEEIHIPEENK